jgi:hypothetical protein
MVKGKTLHIQVIKCKNDNFWYRNKIGENYEVTESKSNHSEDFGKVIHYIVKRENSTLLYFDADDCIVVTRRMKIMKLKEKYENLR